MAWFMSDRQAYKPVATSDPEDGDPELALRRVRTLRIKKVLLHLVAVAAVMYAAFSGVKYLVRELPKLARGGACHGPTRNLSSLPAHFTLASGDKIPSVALGTASPGDVGAAVTAALQAGYRHIDDAWIYRNEAEVGKAIKASGISREELWITSKLWNTFHAPEDVEPALDESLARLQTDYLDLYLIHWPIAFDKNTNTYDEVRTRNPYPTWQKLEEMVEKGKVRNIGVSNFNIPRIKNLTANPLKIRPAVNQVEVNYYNPQPELLKWSADNGILIEAYSPLGSSKQVKQMLSLSVITGIADELGITPAQVVISWHIQRGTIVLPKSITPSRVEENFKVYELPEEHFNKLEEAATSHPPQRISNPSKNWGLSFDVFDDDGGVIVPDSAEETTSEREGEYDWRVGVAVA